MNNLRILFTAVFSLALLMSQAQIIAPTEVQAQMSEGKANGWRVFVPLNDRKATLNGWKKFCKEYSVKVENVKKSEDYFASGAVIPSLGSEKCDIYAQLEESKEGTYLTSFVKIKGAYLNSHQEQGLSTAWSKMMQEFARTLAEEVANEQLSNEEKELKEKNKTMEKLVKDKSGYEKDILDCEQTIVERKNQIEQNVKDQASQTTDIADQENKVDAAKNLLKQYQK
jgi:hypothetical protein